MSRRANSLSNTAFDVAIVGGGPAGCSAAITLAGWGARVALFETKAYPHDKLCGEFLSPECAHLLEKLGLTTTLRALQPVSISSVCVTANTGAIWETRLPSPAWGLTRRALDAALAERANALGVTVRPATTVTGLSGDLQQGFTLETQSTLRADSRSASTLFFREQIQARTVIAAHGKRGAFDRALGRRFLNQPHPFVALKAHFHGPPLPNRIELHAFPGGYCGLSEIEGGAANVCLLAHETVFRGAAPAGPERLPAFLNWMRAQNRHLGDWLAQAEPIHTRWLSIGQVPFVRKRPVVNEVLMAGDAAGLIVPLAGDGIAMALRGGRLAADHSAKFLNGELPRDELPRQYGWAWHKEFSARLRLSRGLQSVMLRPYLLAGALKVLSAVPWIGDYLITHTRDLSHLYKESL